MLNRLDEKKGGHSLGKGRGNLKKSLIAERRVESWRDARLKSWRF